MKNESIVWCIQNCAAYVMSEDAQVELTNITARIDELTAANESMQEDAVQNTYALSLFKELNEKQAEEIRTQAAEIERLTEKVRYAYVQIEALERAK